MTTTSFLQLAFLSTLFCFGQSLTSSSTSLDLSSVVALRCVLQNDSMVDFFIKLALNETTCPISNCNSSIADIIQAANLDKLNTSFLANSTTSLNVTDITLYNTLVNSNMTVKSILYYFNTFDTTFSEIYDNFVSLLKNPASLVPAILKIINVDINGFLSELSFGTDESRLQVLSSGNYSLNNTKFVLKIANLSVVDMISCLPLTKMAKNIHKISLTQINNFFGRLGINGKHFKAYFSTLNVSSKVFNNYTRFGNIIYYLDKYLNRDNALGVFTSKTEVAISSRTTLIQKVNLDFVLNYTDLYLHSLNTSTKYNVGNISLQNGNFLNEISFLYTNVSLLGASANIGLIYNDTKIYNCTYVTASTNGSLITEYFSNALVDKLTFTITKSNKTTFALGSPIFCQNKMYGLAIESNTDRIRFTKFKSYNVSTSPTAPISPGGTDKNSGSILNYNVATFFVVVMVIVFSN